MQQIRQFRIPGINSEFLNRQEILEIHTSDADGLRGIRMCQKCEYHSRK